MARVELGERIATLREEQALTQAELAQRAKISPSTLSLIESGRVPRPTRQHGSQDSTGTRSRTPGPKKYRGADPPKSFEAALA
jgi:ribosome-binding protein aMBF1 (putative translation factor)